MFRCQKCKKWLKNITTETDVVYDGKILQILVEWCRVSGISGAEVLE